MKYLIQWVSTRMQPKTHFTSFVVGHNRVSSKWRCGVFIHCTLYWKGRMMGSKFSAQNKVTRPFWAVFGRAVFIGTEQNVSGVFKGGAGCLWIGDVWGRKWFLGVLRKKFRIKEFNPRLIYFHYLQDWNKNTIKLEVHRQAMWDYQPTVCKN